MFQRPPDSKYHSSFMHASCISVFISYNLNTDVFIFTVVYPDIFTMVQSVIFSNKLRI